MMDQTYPLKDMIHSHCSVLQLSANQQSQRIRFERLKQQRNRMQSLGDLITNSHRTIFNLQKKVQLLSEQSKKWELLYLQLQKQNEELREKNKLFSFQLNQQRNQTNKLAQWNTELQQQLFRVQNLSTNNRMSKQFNNIDTNQKFSLQDGYYKSFIDKYSKLQRKLAKKEKQNMVLHLEIQNNNKSLQQKKNYKNLTFNHQSMNLQKFRKSKYSQVKSEIRKCNAIKDRQKIDESYSRKLKKQFSEKNLKVCPCHFIGKSPKSKRKFNDSLY